MAAEAELQRMIEEAVAFPSRNLDPAPSFSGQLESMWREGLKDVREKMMESFFGQRDGAYEIGTPLAPTPQMVTDDLEPSRLDALIHEASAQRAPEQDRGMEI